MESRRPPTEVRRIDLQQPTNAQTHNGFKISENEGIPLSDGFLIAATLQHSKPVIVTNDCHIIKTAAKYGLITENPIPGDVKEKLSHWKNE